MAKLNLTLWRELDDNVDTSILPRTPTKLKLLADQNISVEIVNDFKDNGISIKSVYDLKLKDHPDENILAASKKLGRILLTTDKDFWDERKHAVMNCGGIFCIESGPQMTNNIYHSFIYFHHLFARYVNNEHWRNTKALLKTDSFILRAYQDWGAITEQEFKTVGRKIYVRHIR